MKKKKEKFGVSELSRRTGVPYATLNKWIRKDVIKPEGYREWAFEGYAMWFTEKTVREVLLLRKLRKIGVSFQKIREAAKILRSYGHNPFSSGTFIAFTQKGLPMSLVKIKDGKIIELVGKYKSELLFPLWNVKRKFRHKELNKTCDGKNKRV